MSDELREIRCPSCHHLLFKAIGPINIEIVCTGTKCRHSGNRVKRLIDPHPLSFTSPSGIKAQTRSQDQNAVERQSQMRDNDAR